MQHRRNPTDTLSLDDAKLETALAARGNWRIISPRLTRRLVAAGRAAVGISAAELEQRTIGIQFGAVSLVDESIEQVLDIVQQRAAVNTLFPAVYSYSSGTAGRQLRGHPYPGHGKQGGSDFRGGNFATVHPRFYRDTALNPLATQAPDHKGFDVLGAVVPAARNDV